MRVLFWTATFLPYLGGVEVLGSRLLVALRDRGYEIVVVTRQDSLDLPRDDEFAGIRIRRFPFRQALESGNPERIFEERRRLAELKRVFAPHLVNVYHPGTDIWFHMATRAAAKSTELAVLHFALPPEMLRAGSLMREWLVSTTWVAVCSAWVLADTTREIPEIAPRSSVLYGSLAPPPIVPRPLSFDPPRLVCIGRVIHEKGFDVAVDALGSILARFPKARLTIAGDGPLRLELEQRCAELGLMPHVDFLGWVSPDHVPALINDATLVIMPSRREHFGLVALQAAQMERPIVASSVGGLPEIVLHQETGLLVPPEDSDAVAEATVALLNDPDSAIRMGRAARRWVEGRFKWDDYVDAYDKLCRDLARNGETPP